MDKVQEKKMVSVSNLALIPIELSGSPVTCSPVT